MTKKEFESNCLEVFLQVFTGMIVQGIDPIAARAKAENATELYSEHFRSYIEVASKQPAVRLDDGGDVEGHARADAYIPEWLDWAKRAWFSAQDENGDVWDFPEEPVTDGNTWFCLGVNPEFIGNFPLRADYDTVCWNKESGAVVKHFKSKLKIAL